MVRGLISKRYTESVVGDARLNAALLAKLPDPRCNTLGIALHDATAAMSEDRASDALGRAPSQLSRDRYMADQRMIAHPNHRAHNGGAVTYIKIDAAQRLALIFDGGKVRDIEKG